MRYATAILISLTFAISGLTCLWHGQTQIVNWIYARPTPMALEWNVKYLADEINALLIAVSIYTYRANPVNKSASIAYVFYCAVDIVLYFYDYKTGSYELLYFFLPFITLLAYYWRQQKHTG